MRFDRVVLPLISIVLPAVAMAGATGPTGYGKASFGMPLEEVQKLYPKLEALGENNSLGAPAVGGPHIRGYALRDQTVPGHEKPVQVELRFWKGKFWLYITYFDKTDLDGLVKHLTAQYGEPKSASTGYPLWAFENSTIQVDTKESRYTINDNSLSDEARAWFMGVLQESHPDKDFHLVEKTAAPAESPSPAPTQP